MKATIENVRITGGCNGNRKKIRVLSCETFHLYWNGVLQLVTHDKEEIKNCINNGINFLSSTMEQYKIVSNYTKYDTSEFLTSI